MASLNDQIRARVEAFVSELEGLVRQAALQSLTEALALPSGAAPQRRGPGRPPKNVAKPSAAPSHVSAPAAPARAGGKGKRIRRSASQLAAVADRIHAFVVENPGKRGEEIKAALKLGTKEWSLPVQLLIETGRLTTKGAKRATSYFSKR